MKKVWLVARHQFREETSKRSFLFILFLMPIILTFLIGFGYLIALVQKEETALGYVDQAGFLRTTEIENGETDVTLAPFDSAETAQTALENGEIDAYFIIGQDYRETRKAELVYKEQPPYRATQYFEDVVRVNLVSGQDPAVANRLLEGAMVTVRAIDFGREYVGGGPSAGLFAPLLVAVLFAFLILTTAGYMTSVLAEEKGNKTIEIVVTSLSVGRLMAGKVLGALGIALVQLTLWVVFLVGAVFVGANILEIGWLQDLQLFWRDIFAVIIVAIPAYLFISALMALIGSMMSDAAEAEQVGPFSMLMIFLPIYMFFAVLSSPNGPLSLVMTFIPPTSLMTIAMRSLVMVVPWWQIAVSAAISLLSGLFTVWLAGRAFRLSMLRYGKRLRLGELFGRKSKARLTPAT